MTSKACSKIILFGEHAVVYGKPGIALPIKTRYTLATISKADSFSYSVEENLTPEERSNLDRLFETLFGKLEIKDRNINIYLESNIPLGSGLGSSASLSIAIIRELLKYFNISLDNDKINALAFECEKIFHGSPSGIDNTVITYERPLYFQNKELEFIELKVPLSFVIANTGIKSDTKAVVSEVRKKYEENNKKYSKIIDNIEDITRKARAFIEAGDINNTGKLMVKNHSQLKHLGVSCNELDRLVDLATKNGAYGAKLAGAGKGGNIIALVDEKNKEKVFNALKNSFARNIITAVVA